MESSANHEDLIRKLQAEVARLKEENKKLQVSNRRWMRIAGTDDQTGLPNKIFFSTALLPQLISKADAEGQHLACIMVAPDGLGEINERYGRKGGDFMVEQLAEFLKGNVASDEKLVHIDGANFVLLLPGAELQLGKRKSLALRAKIRARTFEYEKNTISLTLSMGVVARAPSSSADPPVNSKNVVEEFLRRLSSMLDQAKHQGGDRAVDDPDTHF